MKFSEIKENMVLSGYGTHYVAVFLPVPLELRLAEIVIYEKTKVFLPEVRSTLRASSFDEFSEEDLEYVGYISEDYGKVNLRKYNYYYQSYEKLINEKKKAFLKGIETKLTTEEFETLSNYLG